MRRAQIETDAKTHCAGTVETDRRDARGVVAAFVILILREVTTVVRVLELAVLVTHPEMREHARPDRSAATDDQELLPDAMTSRVSPAPTASGVWSTGFVTATGFSVELDVLRGLRRDLQRHLRGLVAIRFRKDDVRAERQVNRARRERFIGREARDRDLRIRGLHIDRDFDDRGRGEALANLLVGAG